MLVQYYELNLMGEESIGVFIYLCNINNGLLVIIVIYLT